MSTPPLPTRKTNATGTQPVPVESERMDFWDVKHELCNIARAVKLYGMSADDSEKRRHDLYRRANVKDASGYERYYHENALNHIEDPGRVKEALERAYTEILNGHSIDRWKHNNRPICTRHKIMLLACAYLGYDSERGIRKFLFARNIVCNYLGKLLNEKITGEHQRFVKYAKESGFLQVESFKTQSNFHARPSQFTLTGDWWKDYLPTVQT